MVEAQAVKQLKVVIFGATGGTGIQLVKQALDAGHHVSVYVRNPDKLNEITNSNLEKVKGELSEQDKIDSVV